MQTFNDICISEASDLIKQQGGFPEGWSIDSLNDLHAIVSRILCENKNKIDNNWSITFGELCRIIHQERAQTKFEQDYNHHQKMKAASKS